MRTTTIFFFILLISNDFAFAQDTIAQKDSTHLYENIETYSERSSFTKFMFRLFFKPVAPASSQKIRNKRLIQKPYSSFEGKIIRQINITTLDPFGYSIGDTIAASLNFLSKTGNRLHIKTQTGTIRNLLLVRKNQPFDSLTGERVGAVGTQYELHYRCILFCSGCPGKL